MYALINNDGDLEVYAESCDLCHSCKNRNLCPLIQAICKEYVFMHYSDIEVKECGLFTS